MAERLVLRKRCPYNTNANRRRIVKTPGGKLVYQYKKKQGSFPKCGDCRVELKGIVPTRPAERPRLSKRFKTVTRAYGGSRCHNCVRSRVVRAFLIEEQKIVMKVLKAQATLKK